MYTNVSLDTFFLKSTAGWVLLKTGAGDGDVVLKPGAGAGDVLEIRSKPRAEIRRWRLLSWSRRLWR